MTRMSIKKNNIIFQYIINLIAFTCTDAESPDDNCRNSAKRFSTNLATALLLVCVLLVTGCSSVYVPVPVMRPAEVTLGEKNKVAIGGVRGKGGSLVEDYLIEELEKSEAVSLVERRFEDRLLREMLMSPSDYVKKRKNGGFNESATASVLIVGEMIEYSYNENRSRYARTCRKKVKIDDEEKTIEYTCYVNTRSGIARAKTSFKLIDMESGEIMAPRVVFWEEKDYDEELDDTPRYFNSHDMLDKCARSIARQYARTISPWTETVRVKFYKDRDLPSLEAGVKCAEAGQWSLAIDEFQKAVLTAQADSSIDAESAARAHWNLGLAYEYTGKFDDAYQQIKKAYLLHNKDEYLKELNNVENMARERKKLEKQLNK